MIDLVEPPWRRDPPPDDCEYFTTTATPAEAGVPSAPGCHGDGHWLCWFCVHFDPQYDRLEQYDDTGEEPPTPPLPWPPWWAEAGP